MTGWQDYVFLGGNVVFFIALLPAILRKQGPPLSSCLLTGGMLFIYAFTFLTLDLWKSAAGSALTAIAWSILALQALSRSR